MRLALSTRWNARRHTRGELLIEEILALGIDRVELGYDLRMDLVPGVRSMVDRGAVTVGSVHNFCPVPMGVSRGHPELFTLADPDPRVRAQALKYTRKTLEFAADMGAGAVVLHGGNVRMRRYTVKLLEMQDRDQQLSPRYQRLTSKMLRVREKKVRKQFAWLKEGLAELVPDLKKHHIRLGIENLPTWEALPTEEELSLLMDAFDTPLVGYWHDTGHGQIRENLGLSSHIRTIMRFKDRLVGMHLHDVRGAGMDHVMPPGGTISFRDVAAVEPGNIPLVIEPAPGTKTEEIIAARDHLQQAWSASADRNTDPRA